MRLKRIKVTAGVLELLAQHRVATSRSLEPRWRTGEVISILPEARLENYTHILAGHMMPYAFGAFTYSHSSLNPELSVGRYGSIAWGATVISGDHPIDWATTSPFTHQPHDIRGLQSYLQDKGMHRFDLYGSDPGLKPAMVGHDVWIGQQVMIKRGVNIGHGAVVGAGSVVIKDVPPYAIVGGVPAKVLRYRFPENLIDRFLVSAWWRFGPDVLQPLDPREPAGFLDRLDHAIADGAEPMELPVLTGEAVIAAGELVS